MAKAKPLTTATKAQKGRVTRVVAVLAIGLVTSLAAPAAAAAAGSIGGNIVDVEGTPLTDMCVSAVGAYAADPFNPPAGSAQAEVDGDYLIDGLTPGQYKVEFSDTRTPCDAGAYLTQWYDGWNDVYSFGSGFFSATVIIVQEGLITTGIDAAMQGIGSISGRVTDTAGSPLGGICIIAQDVSSTSALDPGTGYGQTNADGTYSVGGLYAGAYKVSFYDDGHCGPGNHLGQWYDGRSEPGSADAVVVTAGNATAGIDAVMQGMGRISGRVTDASGTPLMGICVVVQRADTANPDGNPPGFAQTADDGTYAIRLAVGSYKVSFYDNGIPCSVGKYVGQWYNGKPDFASADVLVVTTGATLTGIDAAMQLAGQTATRPVTTAPPPPTAVTRCRVPRLRGIPVRKAKRLLRRARCGVGRVTTKRSAKRLHGKVIATKPRARTVRPAGTRVALVVGRRR